MHTTFRNLFLLSILLTANATIFAQDEGWKLKQDKDGIRIYTRAVTGSTLDEFKAEAMLPTTLDRMVDVLMDADNMKAWSPDCERSELIERVSNGHYYYMETDAPFPIQNRDMVAHLTYELKEGSAHFQVTAAPDMLPEKEGIVRIRSMQGSWKIEEAGKDMVKVTYQVHADPGGSIPEWLANATAVDNPYQTFMNLQEYIQ